MKARYQVNTTEKPFKVIDRETGRVLATYKTFQGGVGMMYTLEGTTWQAILFEEKPPPAPNQWVYRSNMSSWERSKPLRDKARKHLERIASGKRPTVSRGRALPKGTTFGYDLRRAQRAAYIENVGREPRTIYDLVLSRGGSREQAAMAMEQWK